MKRLKEKVRRTWDWLSIYRPVETAVLIAMLVSSNVELKLIDLTVLV